MKKVKASSGSQLIESNRLDFWLKQKYNVIFEGKHGVGKTSIVLDAFKRNKLRYVCLSGATMDPFIDFVGVPVKVKTPKGEQIIDLLRPKYIQDANPQAIFIDEFNRSHKKVRNAVMELIQFKTINGQKISKDLQVVWAAVNPEDDVYDTDRLDPAQKDRFHIQVAIPYQCDRSYFIKTYGDKTANAAIEYWNNIPTEIRNLVSPRRLDYALRVIKDGGDPKDVLPLSANVSSLLLAIKSGPAVVELDRLLKVMEKVNYSSTHFPDASHENEDAIRTWFENETNFNRTVELLKTKRVYFPLLQFVPKEKLAQLVSVSSRVCNYVASHIRKYKEHSPFHNPLKEIIAAKQNTSLSKRLARLANIMPKPKKTVAINPAKVLKGQRNKFKPTLIRQLPSGPMARALISLLLIKSSSMKDLQRAATKAKHTMVPVSRIESKLKWLDRTWASPKGLRIVFNTATNLWSLQ